MNEEIRDVLIEFVDDVEDIGADFTAQDWPDLYQTYLKAKKVLEVEALDQ